MWRTCRDDDTPDDTKLPDAVYTVLHRAQARARRTRHRHIRRRQHQAAASGAVPDTGADTLSPRQDTTSSMVAAPVLAAGSPRQRQGRHGENQAAAYLQHQGLHILARNLYCKMGEIDIVARDHAVLVFVEVRRRTTRSRYHAAASVNRRKQLRLMRAAAYFLPRLTQSHFNGQMPACRFDVISLDDSMLRWLQHAFSPDDYR